MGVPTDNTDNPKAAHTAQQEAREWFASASTDPGTFNWVCLQLGLHPETFLRGVNEVSSLPPKERKSLCRGLMVSLRR